MQLLHACQDLAKDERRRSAGAFWVLELHPWQEARAPAASSALDGPRPRGQLCSGFLSPSLVASRLFGTMEDEDGYTVLEKRGAAGSPGPLQHAEWSLEDPWGGFAPQRARVLGGPLRCPRCLLGATLAALLLSLGACVVWLVAERGQPEGTAARGNATLCSDRLNLELRKSLCTPTGGEGCWLCPASWRLRGTKCYWFGNGIDPWNQSRVDCVNRGAQLVMLGDREELDFLIESIQKPTSYYWIGLLLSPVQGWTWLNGSRLDRSCFQLNPPSSGGACGVLKGGRITSENCSAELKWICQKKATHL
ncbi:killer cell lectin-like receptor subfamily B member 1B allele B [Tyto alba]|uniref:killer cell lectin-like receptor subfamily B member 1B allele B n=1 Tax=Tyto alba TaxID=56313 RepID=UPI001C67C6A9|nr:killer cell lectin-like receptor subfamily B member 1B allele B [Tyto alba]